MAKNKTIETENSVTGYLALIKDDQRRKDCKTIIDLVSKHTGIKPKMWGTSIVGFGSYNYKYESGHEGSAPLAGFSSRATAIVLYLGSAFENREELLSKLGKYKAGKGCIYIKKLEDTDTSILVKMFSNAIKKRNK